MGCVLCPWLTHFLSSRFPNDHRSEVQDAFTKECHLSKWRSVTLHGSSLILHGTRGALYPELLESRETHTNQSVNFFSRIVVDGRLSPITNEKWAGVGDWRQRDEINMIRLQNTCRWRQYITEDVVLPVSHWYYHHDFGFPSPSDITGLSNDLSIIWYANPNAPERCVG